MTSLLHKGATGLFWNYLSKFITFSTLLLFLMVISRGLGSELYGTYSLVMAIVGFFLLITFGFEEILNKYIPRMIAKSEEKKLKYVLKKTFMLRLITSASISILLFFFSTTISMLVGHIEIAYYLKICSVYLFFMSLTNIYRFILIGYINIRPVLIVDSLVAILNLFLVYLFINFGYGISELIWVLTITSMLSYVLYRKPCKKYLIGNSVKCKFNPLFRYGMNMWIISMATFALGNQSDIFLLSYFSRSLSEISFYNIAYTLSRNLGNIVTIGLSGVLLSIYSEVYTKYGSKRLGDMWSLNIKFLVFFLTPIIFFCVYFAKTIIITLFTNEYAPAVYLFQVYILFFFLSWILGGGANMTLLMIIDKENIIIGTRTFSGILNIALDVLLIPKYGALGAIIATGSSTIFVILLEILMIKKYVLPKYPLIFTVKIIIGSLIPLIFISFLLVNIYVGALIYIFTFVVLLFILKPFIKEDGKYIKNLNERAYNIYKHFQSN